LNIDKDSEQCYSSWSNYESSRLEWTTSFAPRTLSVIEQQKTYIQNAGRGSLYTDSDGIPRLASFTVTGTTSEIHHTSWTRNELDFNAMRRGNSFKETEPTCNINAYDCQKIRNSWYSAHSGNESTPRLEQNGTPFIYDPTFPEQCEISECECVVRGQNIALIYWPPNESYSVSNALNMASHAGPGVDSSLVITRQAITLTSTEEIRINWNMTRYSVHNTGMHQLYMLKAEND
jgi:hypothetical protein